MAIEQDTDAAERRADEESAEVVVGVEVDALPAATAPAEDGRVAELQARVDQLTAQLDLAQEKARETFGRLKDEHEQRLRGAADLENYRKRAQREREEIQKFGSERLLKDLLPVVDNLDRALAAAPDGDPVAKGVGLVRKVLEEALARHGVEVFSALGLPFDPRQHEALAQLPAPDAAPGTVVAEHGRGFLLHGRLLRPAMVAVAAPRPSPEAAEGAGEGDAAAPAEPAEGTGE